MLINFDEVHAAYLVPAYRDGSWVYTPANAENPKLGRHIASHQIFSNHALLVGLYIYNSVTDAGLCDGVSHCLYLNFSRKEHGKYLLNRDDNRIAFNLDLGKARALYCFAVGLSDAIDVRVVRAGRSPKRLTGRAEYVEGDRVLSLSAETAGRSISVQLSDTAQITLAAHALAYGRLLYPSLSDTAIQQMFVTGPGIFRACAEKLGDDANEAAKPVEPVRACAEQAGRKADEPEDSPQRQRLKRVIWAIGNQKWPAKRLDALQRIQNEASADDLQRLIDEANLGDFSGWDSYL